MTSPKRYDRIAFVASAGLEAQQALAQLTELYGNRDPADADVVVARRAGSTAYNLSAQGPILPINAALLALTPISAFRPRRWRGALLPNTAFVVIEVLEGDKRPVAAVADHDEARDVRRVEGLSDKTISIRMLFDPGHSLEERILSEQFGH